MALPQCLREQVQVEDDPWRLAAYLLTLLQSGRNSRADGRTALLDYVERSKWEEQWESLLTRVVRLHRLEVERTLGVARPSRVYHPQDGEPHRSAEAAVGIEGMATSLMKQEKGT
jgi:hypothetical protein